MKLTFTLRTQAAREKVLARIKALPEGSRVTIDDRIHTVEQRARFHASLGVFAEKAMLNARKQTEETWRSILLHALRREQEVEIALVPSLDGAEILAVGRSTSNLSAQDYAGLLAILYREAALQGVEIPEPRRRA